MPEVLINPQGHEYTHATKIPEYRHDLLASLKVLKTFLDCSYLRMLTVPVHTCNPVTQDRGLEAG